MILPWQTQVWEDLVKRQQTAGLPHALMFTGISGIGKHQLSLYTAEWLLCQRAKTESLSQPCGSCHSCQLWKAGSHPDFMICQPEDNSRQIRIDSIRKVNEFLAQTPQISHCQVVILKPVEVMNTNAANALLKMLEEPGADTLILLVTSKMGQVLPTIKSRCQHVECPNPTEAEAINWLMAATDLDSEQARSILHINRGAPKEALKYIDGGLSEHRAQVIRGLADILKQRRSVIEVAQSLQKLDLELVLGWLYSLLTDVARCAACEDADSLRQDDARNMLTAVAKKTDPVKIFKLADKVHEERRAVMLRQNPNKQLLLECVLLEWAGLLK